MAAIGAKRPIFCPIASEPDNALPTYTTDGAVVVGQLVSANPTINNSSASLYADDRLVEDVNEISSVTIAMETADILPSVAGVIYGADVDGTEVTYKTGDVPPWGGLCYYRSLMRDNVPLYQGTFYPAAKATVSGQNAQTKGESITFQITTTTFTAKQAANGTAFITKEFATEDEVMAWQDALFTTTAAG